VTSFAATSAPAGGYDTSLYEQIAGVEDRSFWFRGRNRLIVNLASRVTRPGDRVLEVGCGTGYVLRALVRECGLAGTGGELFAEGLDHARRRVPEAELVQVDARSMDYDGDFDLVGAFDVLEHIDDDAAAMAGLRRAVRPGGHVLLTVPQHRWLWSAADEHARHVRRYERQELAALARAAGLEVLRTTSFVVSLLPLMALSRLRPPRQSGVSNTELVPPGPFNRLFELMLDGELALIRRGVDFPVGGSLVLLARRPSA
jgi:SAM-dependent methyltransferase